MGRKNMLKKGRARRRKEKPTPGQRASDARVWACGRKVIYMSEAEAVEIADKLSHLAYRCSYAEHWHTAHLPGSVRIRFGRSHAA